MNDPKPNPEVDVHRPDPAAVSPPGSSGLSCKLGPVGLLLSQFKTLIKRLQRSRFKTLITMLICIGVYGMLLGWSFAIGFVILLFIHEMGHVIALRMLGIKATAPMFIPFMGAFIGMKQRPENAFAEAIMAYGGPLLGTLGAFVCAGIGLLTGNPFWYILAMSGFLLNLFNLLPISPLDGGRIIGVVSPRLWVFGLFGAFALLYLTWSPIIILIIIMGSLQIRSSNKRSKVEKIRYYAVSTGRRVAMGLAFLALLAVASIGMLAMEVALSKYHMWEGAPWEITTGQASR